MTLADRKLFWPWVGWAMACILAMALAPGQETIPYHLGYAGLALAAGLDAWSHFQAVSALGGYTTLTGLVLVYRAANGAIAWEETAEIPLMCLLMVMVFWHMERRNNAFEHATELADRERSQRERRERLVRITSHEMRTPLSIATAYVDLLCVDAHDAKTRDDLEVVREELDRVSMSTARMLRLIRLYEDLPLHQVDIDELLTTTASRWRVMADRRWKVESRLGLQEASEERVRACLDTLVENAVRYTEDGDVIRLFAHFSGGVNVIGVADSGPGFSEAQLASINARGSDIDLALPLISDPRSQTGLGLSLVREVVESRNARLLAGRSTEGGGEVRMVGFPAHAESGFAPSGDVFSEHVDEWWTTPQVPGPTRALSTPPG